MKVAANFGCVHPHFHDVQVFGTEATFVNGLEQATLWTPGDDGPARGAASTRAYPGVEKGDLIALVRRRRSAGGPPPMVTADEVFHVLAVCFAIDRARRRPGPRVAVEAFG